MEAASRRGYFGIGIEAAKTPANVGTLWRSAHAFGAAFIFTIGERYPADREPMDTTDASKHVPLYTFANLEAFTDGLPRGVEVIGVECPGDTELRALTHPERAVYILGAEDRGLSAPARALCSRLAEIPARYCLNVGVAGSIVLYDRTLRR